MSIKLSIKDLKDLLKLQKKQIKKRKRRNKLTKAQPNIRSSSDHMLSHGITMMNTANEQSELIRLQRQALEDKLKADKDKLKADKEKEAKEQNVQDKSSGVVPYNRLSGNGGSNNLRELREDVDDLRYSLNYMMSNGWQGNRVEEIDVDDNEDDKMKNIKPKSVEVVMVQHGTADNSPSSNVKLLEDDDEEEQKQKQTDAYFEPDEAKENFVDEADNDYVANQKAVREQLESTLNLNKVKAYFEEDQPVTEEPVAEEPVAEEPVAEEPVEPVAKEPVAEEPVPKKAPGFKSNSTALTLIGYIQTNKQGKPYLNKTLMNKSREELYAIALSVQIAAKEAEAKEAEAKATDKKKKKKKDATV